MIEAEKLRQVQKRALVLARVNADAYSPSGWWKDDPTRGFRSVLYRFRVAKPGVTPSAGVIALPKEKEDRKNAFFAAVCPSFCEETVRRYLANGKTVVAFTRAATPAREEIPHASQRTVTLYPGSPLLDDDCSGFDLICQLALDMDTLIRFEAEDGFHTLVSLFGRFNRQFGSASGQTDLPKELTESSDLDAELALIVLDALFAPGALFRFDEDVQAKLRKIAEDRSLQCEFRYLTRQEKPILKQELFLSAAIQEFRRICTSKGASALRPISDPQLQRLCAAKIGPGVSDIVADLASFLARFQAARLALNRSAQTLQSNLLLGSIADWVLAKNISGAGDVPLPEFLINTQDTFNRGVAEGRSTVVSPAVRDQAKQRFLTRLNKDLPGEGNQKHRDRLIRLYEMAEPYLCAIPVFRVREVEVNACNVASLLLDEVLAETAPDIRLKIEEGGKRANRQLQTLLSTEGRIELRFPGLGLPTLVLTAGTDESLRAELEPERVVLRGAFTEKNVKDLFGQADRSGRDVADAVFRAFNYGENTLPDDQLDKLDGVVEALYQDLEGADHQLLEQFKSLREGFEAGSRAVAGAALALGREDPRNGGGDIWERTSREAARITISTTALHGLQQPEQPYNRLLSAKSEKEVEQTKLDQFEAEALKLTLAALALPQDDQERNKAVEPLNKSLIECRAPLAKFDAKDLRVQRILQALEAIQSLVDEHTLTSLGAPDAAEDKLGQTEVGIVTMREEVSTVLNAEEVDVQRLTDFRNAVMCFRKTLDELDAKESRVQRARQALDAIERLLNGVSDLKVQDDLQAARDWLVALHEERSKFPALPNQSSASDLKHYQDGRQRVLGHYTTTANDPANTFGGRTRFVWLSQLVMHIHGRLPMAEGRADMGNLCGLVLELVRHCHGSVKSDPVRGQVFDANADQIRDDFFLANPGGLPRFLPLQTIDHTRSLARGYHEQTEESRRTLRDLRNDLKGIEEALKALPDDGELIVLNLTADDFVTLDWDFYPALFDAFALQKDSGPTLIPTALLVSRSAQRWLPSEALARLTDFLTAMDAKVHGDSHSGRCVVPPVLVASELPEPPTSSDPEVILAYRRGAIDALQALGSALETLQAQLSYPVFAVGVPARVTVNSSQDAEQPSRLVECSPYFLLARLCGAALTDQLTREGAIGFPASVHALAFTQPGKASLEELIDSWLGKSAGVGIPRSLGANLFGWLISLIFRAEMGPGSTLGMPISYKNKQGRRHANLTGPLPPQSVNAFWELFETAPTLLRAPTKLELLDGYNAGYVNRLPVDGDPRFGGWSFAPPADAMPTHWESVTSHPAVRYGGGPETLLPWLSQLLNKLY